MLYMVATGAPLTRHIRRGVELGQERGWEVAVVLSGAAQGWFDPDQERDLGVPVITEHRSPDTAKRLPRPSAVVLAPGTFNTINKFATGVADTYALNVLCEALGARRLIVVVPFVSQALAGHPAWLASLAVLRYAGAQLVDPQTGEPHAAEPLESGTGEAVAQAFEWSWAFDRLPLDKLPS